MKSDQLKEYTTVKQKIIKMIVLSYIMLGLLLPQGFVLLLDSFYS